MVDVNRLDHYQFHQREVRQAFDDAANSYDDYAVLQKEVANRLLESIEGINIKPEIMVDLGSGTGYCARRLAKTFKKTKIIQADLSNKMLALSKSKNNRFFNKQAFVVADTNQLPFQEASIDVCISNLMLQWCNDLDRAFSQINKALNKNGLFTFSSFGPDTLRELRESWASVDETVHTNLFVDMHDIGDALIRQGFESPVLNVEHVTMTYQDVKQLMMDLKKIGASNVNNGRRRTLTGRRRFAEMLRAYERFRVNGTLPATYEVIYGHAWKSQNEKEAIKSTQTGFPLESLIKTLKK